MSDTDNTTNKDEVEQQTQHIRTRMWLILAAATVPFLLLSAALFMQADTSNERLLIAAAFIFSFGLAVLAAKLAAHTVVDRYLRAIEELDEAKSDFISVASHQLKSPVSALQYTLEAFEDVVEERSSWDEVEEVADDLRLSADRLNSLTHSLLDITRMETGTMESEPEEFALIDHINGALEELEPIAEEANLSVKREYAIDETLRVKLDPDLLYNVMENLLTNAFEYAKSDTQVEIRIERIDDTVRVSVVNVAEEVSSDDLAGIFDKFERGQSKEEADTGGSGLGLYIAKSYVEYWGGAIGAEKSGKDEVTFSFTIPLR